MAIIATLIGGIIGFASFLVAMIGFDAAFATASAIYIGSGLTVTVLVIIAAHIPRRANAHSTPDAQPA